MIIRFSLPTTVPLQFDSLDISFQTVVGLYSHFECQFCTRCQHNQMKMNVCVLCQIVPDRQIALLHFTEANKKLQFVRKSFAITC